MDSPGNARRNDTLKQAAKSRAQSSTAMRRQSIKPEKEAS